jgi:hypothetical protein
MLHISGALWPEYGTSFYNECISMVHTADYIVKSVEHNVPHQHTVCRTGARYWLTLMTLTFQHRLFLSVATHAQANRCSNRVLNTLQKHQYKTAPHADIVQPQAHADCTEHAGLHACPNPTTKHSRGYGSLQRHFNSTTAIMLSESQHTISTPKCSTFTDKDCTIMLIKWNNGHILKHDACMLAPTHRPALPGLPDLAESLRLQHILRVVRDTANDRNTKETTNYTHTDKYVH